MVALARRFSLLFICSRMFPGQFLPRFRPSCQGRRKWACRRRPFSTHGTCIRRPAKTRPKVNSSAFFFLFHLSNTHTHTHEPFFSFQEYKKETNRRTEQHPQDKGVPVQLLNPQREIDFVRGFSSHFRVATFGNVHRRSWLEAISQLFAMRKGKGLSFLVVSLVFFVATVPLKGFVMVWRQLFAEKLETIEAKQKNKRPTGSTFAKLNVQRWTHLLWTDTAFGPRPEPKHVRHRLSKKEEEERDIIRKNRYGNRDIKCEPCGRRNQRAKTGAGRSETSQSVPGLKLSDDRLVSLRVRGVSSFVLFRFFLPGHAAAARTATTRRLARQPATSSVRHSNNDVH